MWRTLCDGYKQADINAFSQTQQYEDIIVAFIKMFIHFTPKGNSILWRAHGIVTDQMVPIIQRRFPKHKILFSYRDALSCAKSYHKITKAIPMMKRRIEIMYSDLENPNPTGESRTSRLYWASSSQAIHLQHTYRVAKLQPNIFEWYVLLWATKVKLFQQYQRDGIPIKCVYYDHLVQSPKAYITRVFEYLGISLTHNEAAAQSMNYDSQAGLTFSRDKQAAVSTWCRDGAQVNRCNTVLSMLELPDLDSKYMMNDTF